MPITNANYPATLTSPKGFEGMRAATEDVTVRTGMNADTVVLPFGFGLVWPTTPTPDNALVLPSGTGFSFAGVAHKSDTFEKRSDYRPEFNSINSNGLMGYPQKRELAFLTEGLILVYCEQAANPKLPVYLRHTIGTDTTTQFPGRWRTDADTNKADLIPAPNARWAEVTAGPGLIWLAIDLP